MRKLDTIIIHCTATRSGWMEDSPTTEKVNEVRRWHLDRGWSDVGYHYLIDRDGTIASGRPVERSGAHKEVITGDLSELLCLAVTDLLQQTSSQRTSRQSKGLLCETSFLT